MTIMDHKKGYTHDNDDNVGYQLNFFSNAIDVFDNDVKVHLSERDVFNILGLIDLYTLQSFVNIRMERKMKEVDEYIKDYLERR